MTVAEDVFTSTIEPQRNLNYVNWKCLLDIPLLTYTDNAYAYNSFDSVMIIVALQSSCTLITTRFRITRA